MKKHDLEEWFEDWVGKTVEIENVSIEDAKDNTRYTGTAYGLLEGMFFVQVDNSPGFTITSGVGPIHSRSAVNDVIFIIGGQRYTAYNYLED